MLGRFARIVVTILMAMSVLMTTSVMRGSARAAAGLSFPRPATIEPNVKFWVDVFAGYGERDFVIHDRDHVWRVYQVMHIPGEGTPTRDEVDSIKDYLKVKYANILSRLAAGQQPANFEEQRVAALFKGESSATYALAAQNLRVQQGMREQFRDGLLRSRYYRSTMERIFRAVDVPPELVTLAEVESGFETRAKSSAGAVGIWQFTRGTGKEFMRITRYHDDRLNPITETAAAARLLRANYETLGNWPLAITAYNYGTGGMAEASSEYHGDYAAIVRNYSGSRFGFASKNYYPEFLAALQVHQYEEQYFPELKYAETPTPAPVRTDLAPRRQYVRHQYAGHHPAATHRLAIHHVRHTHRHHPYVAQNGRTQRVPLKTLASATLVRGLIE